MQNTTDIALSRLVAQQRSMDITANNIANADTPGYKTERVLFSDWLSRQTGTDITPGDRTLAYTQDRANNIANADTPGYKTERVLFSDWLSRQTGTDITPGDRTLAYTQDRATYRDQQAGALSQTGNPLDVAISGEGFFTVQTAQGVRLTRAGRFALMPDGTVADINGNALLSTSGQPVQIPAGDSGISVAGDGTIATKTGVIGKIGVVQPDDMNQMLAEGGRLFNPQGPTTPVANTQLVQGAVENSNVQPVLEMTRMMNDLREFQYVSQFVQAESDRMAGAIDKITKRG